MSRLTDGELDVMRVLWKHGQLKPAEIIEHFPRPIQNSAMRSFLSVLLRKGHVIRKREGRAYFYSARTLPDPAFKSMIRKLVETFCGGSVEELVFRLIQTEKMSEKQLLELKRMAAGAGARKPDRKTVK